MRNYKFIEKQKAVTNLTSCVEVAKRDFNRYMELPDRKEYIAKIAESMIVHTDNTIQKMARDEKLTDYEEVMLDHWNDICVSLLDVIGYASKLEESYVEEILKPQNVRIL